jgi:hypothetical protein
MIDYASPIIEGIGGRSTIRVVAMPENDERPVELRECIIGVTIENGRSVGIRLSRDAAVQLADCMLECFEDVPGAVKK